MASFSRDSYFPSVVSLFMSLGIIRSCLIKRTDRVVSEDSVLGYESGAQSVRVFVKQAVVADAETDYYVEVGLFSIEEFSLHYGVAHVFSHGFTLRTYADARLGLSAYLTCSADDFEAVASEYLCRRAGLCQQTNTCGDPQLSGADFFANSMISSIRVILQ